MAMQRGVIKRIGAKGFGFITPSDDGPTVFFHKNECGMRHDFLQAGDHVLYEINQFARDGRDRPRACEVRVIDAR